MSSACSTSYNIHEAQHLIPACPFNGCRYPVVAERLVSLAILATASDYLQPSEIYTHTDRRVHTHTRADTHSPRRPLPWIYQSRDCKLWSIINSDGVRQWRYREMVKQGAFLTSALYFNWQPWHNFPRPPWHNQYSSLVLMHVHWHPSLESGAKRNYEEIRRCSCACFWDSIHRLSPRPLSYPLFTLFLYYSIWSVIRECIMTSLQFPSKVARALGLTDWKGCMLTSTQILARGISAPSGGAMSRMCVAFLWPCTHTLGLISVCVCVSVNVYVNGIGGRQSRRSHEPRRARNESGNGDDPRGL